MDTVKNGKFSHEAFLIDVVCKAHNEWYHQTVKCKLEPVAWLFKWFWHSQRKDEMILIGSVDVWWSILTELDIRGARGRLGEIMENSYRHRLVSNGPQIENHIWQIEWSHEWWTTTSHNPLWTGSIVRTWWRLRSLTPFSMQCAAKKTPP